MPGQPVETAVGIAGIGLGVLMVYASFRNVPLTGENGLLTYPFLHGGKLPPRPASAGVVMGDVGKRAAEHALELGNQGIGVAPLPGVPVPRGTPVPISTPTPGVWV